MELIATLDALGKQVNERYPRINYGGCAVYANIVGQALIAKGITVSGICAGSSWGRNGNVDSARENVKNVARKEQWRDNGIGFSHVGLEFWFNRKKYHYDSNGVHKPHRDLDGIRIFKGRMYIHEVAAIAGEARGWNSSFNRRSIPALRRMVAKAFADL